MLEREPALTIGTVTGAIAAVIALLVAYGVDVSEEQQNAILAFIPPLFAIIVAASAIIRGFVFAPRTVERLEGEAYVEGESNRPLTPAGSPPAG